LLYFVARDTDSTKYSRGIDEYNYSQATVPVSPTTNMTVTNDNQYTTVTKVLHMPVWTVDPNWENYATRYMATWNQDEFYSDATMKVFANGIQVVSTSDRSNTRSGSYDSGVSNGAYNRDFWSIRIVSGQQYGAGDFTLTPTSTTAYLRQKLLNSAAAQNNYTFQSYSWAVSGSSSIAQGSMNWVAIGD
jgi:hypothetical protein